MDTPQPDVTDRVNGTHVFLALSEGDFGATDETITFLERMHGDLTISYDPEVVEYNFAGNQFQVTDEGHRAGTIEIELYPDSNTDTDGTSVDLEAMNLVNTDGTYRANVEANYRLYAFDRLSDTTPALSRAFENVRWQFNEEEFPENDPANQSLEGYIHGPNVYFDPPAFDES